MNSIIIKEVEDEQYRFDCVNVKIGIIGATRRVSTTTLALELVNFIKNHGGTACYAALNTNGHVESMRTPINSTQRKITTPFTLWTSTRV
jgi:hypothetical protein